MKTPAILSHLSPDTLLDLLGLQHKPATSTTVLSSVGLVVGGAVVGATVALLLAPKSGRALRGDIREGAHELQSRAGNVLHEAQVKVGSLRSHANVNNV